MSSVVERKRQELLDAQAVTRKFPDAEQKKGESGTVWFSDGVKLSNYKNAVFFSEDNGMSPRTFCRLVDSVKRPGQERIKVFSSKRYFIPVKGVIQVLNSFSKVPPDLEGLVSLGENLLDKRD